MEIGERVKLLRQDLHLSQSAFGSKLGVSRSVINNLERGVLVNQSGKLPLIKLMALKFGVSEDWLLRGQTARVEYVPTCGTPLYACYKDGGADDADIAFVRAYFELDRVQRKKMLQTFRELIDKAYYSE